MLAYVYDEDKKLKVKEVPLPVHSDESMIIKVNSCSICGTDFRTYIKGSTKITPPRIIGHEVSGTIVEIGKKVFGYSKGDRITLAPAIGCGECRSCKTGHPNMCDNLETIGFQYDGGFAEYMEIPSKAIEQGNVNKLSVLIDDDEAALAEPIACAVNSQEYLKVEEDDYVAIFGSGFIGSMQAELSFLAGASKVIMIDISQSRLEEVKALVPNVTIINPTTEDLYAKVDEVTDGRGADVVITACSAGIAQKQALDIAAKRGRISLFGGLVGESNGFIDSNLIHYKELQVFGVHASTPLQNKKVIDMISKGVLDVKPYITATYGLSEIETALERIKNESIMKAIIKPSI